MHTGGHVRSSVTKFLLDIDRALAAAHVKELDHKHVVKLTAKNSLKRTDHDAGNFRTCVKRLSACGRAVLHRCARPVPQEVRSEFTSIDAQPFLIPQLRVEDEHRPELTFASDQNFDVAKWFAKRRDFYDPFASV